jgi:hypothetical protein
MHNYCWNRLSVDNRIRMLAALVDGNSIRGTARMIRTYKKIVKRRKMRPDGPRIKTVLRGLPIATRCC